MWHVLEIDLYFKIWYRHYEINLGQNRPKPCYKGMKYEQYVRIKLFK